METVKVHSSNSSNREGKRETQRIRVGDNMGDIIGDKKPTRSRHREQRMYVWALLLGLAGLVDILGTVLDDLARRRRNETCTLKDEECEMETSFWTSIIEWFDRYDILISFVFSALWFLDAFWTANRKKRNAMERQEYQQLNKPKDATTVHWRHNPRFAYFWSISLQLLCLPVGFYGVFYFGLHRMAIGGTLQDLKHLEDDVFDVVDIAEDGSEHHESFSVRSKKAFIFVILQRVAGRTTQLVMQHAKSKVAASVKKLTKRVFSKAIFNPVKFRRQLKKVLKIARYLTYGLPLFGKLNRILGLLTLTWKRQRQRHEAQKARRARQLLWESKPRKVREVDAAIMIQSVFRSKQSRKALKALRVFKADKEYIAILKIQHILRRKLRERRAYLEAKRRELERLEQLKDIDDADKLRMYELRFEVLHETKELLNRKMLMRPNTKFAVYWKLFFAICLILEVTGAALKPLLKKRKRSKRRKHQDGPTTVSELISQKFVPTRMSDWPQCQIVEDKHGFLDRFTHKAGSGQHKQDNEDSVMNALPWYCKDPFSSTQESIRDVLALSLIPKPVSEWPECIIKDSTPSRRRFPLFRRKHREEDNETELDWYCKSPYSRIHQLYRDLVDWFWSEWYVVLLGVGYFLDVPITFFTGEFDKANGVLVPKPIFVRWILPGLLLQLAVNPYMKTVGSWFSAAFRSSLKFGPVRVYRWNATVLFPLLFFVWKHVMLPLWLSLVEFENNHRLIPDDVLY